MTRTAVATVSASPSLKLERAAFAVRVRQRVQRAIDASVALGAAACAVLTTWALIAGPNSALSTPAWLIFALAPVAGGALWALGPLPALSTARAIDRALDTPDLIASALSFEALPYAEQTPFMRACVAQAERASERLVPARAVKFQVPRALPILCAFALALLGLTHSPAREPVAALSARAPAAAVLDSDIRAAFASELEAQKAQPLDPEARALVDALNALLERIAAGELERAEALAELRRIEDRLRRLLARDPQAREAAFEQIGRALAGTPEAKPLEKALREDWPQAARELKKLSERVAAGLRADAERRLSKALERAADAQANAGQAAAIDEAKRELDRLLREHQERTGSRQPSFERQDRLLERKRRELDQLERQHEQTAAAERELEQLKRELDAASNALGERDSKSAAEKLEDAANELERHARQEQARSQAGRLAEQLAQLRAEIARSRGQSGREGSREDAPGGAPIPLSVQRFGRIAHGSSSGDGRPDDSHGGTAAPQPGAGQGHGEGSAGQRVAELRPGGGQGDERIARLEPNAGSNESGRGSDQGLDGAPKSGPATAGSGQHIDTRIEGELRAGPSRSEVIFESSQRGFADEGYAKVHGDYARHAESVLEREHVPGGYRYYVRRYFQLIRPRESSQGAP